MLPHFAEYHTLTEPLPNYFLIFCLIIERRIHRYHRKTHSECFFIISRQRCRSVCFHLPVDTHSDLTTCVPLTNPCSSGQLPDTQILLETNSFCLLLCIGTFLVACNRFDVPRYQAHCWRVSFTADRSSFLPKILRYSCRKPSSVYAPI